MASVILPSGGQLATENSRASPAKSRQSDFGVRRRLSACRRDPGPSIGKGLCSPCLMSWRLVLSPRLHGMQRRCRRHSTSESTGVVAFHLQSSRWDATYRRIPYESLSIDAIAHQYLYRARDTLGEGTDDARPSTGTGNLEAALGPQPQPPDYARFGRLQSTCDSAQVPKVRDRYTERCELRQPGQLEGPRGASALQQREESGNDAPMEGAEPALSLRCSSCFRGWAVASQCAQNDAAIVKRGLVDMDLRARSDVARIRTGVTYLDERARADAFLLDTSAKKRLRRLRSFALGMEEAARMELLETARQHRDANGALMANLQIADTRARRRALEDAYSTWQVAKQVHESIVRVLRSCEARDKVPSQPFGKRFSASASASALPEEEGEGGDASLHWSTRTLGGGEWHTSAILEAVRELRDVDMRSASGSAFSSGISSSEELEFLLAALLDMDEVSEGSGALLLAQQLDSPDVATRRAIVDVLAAAPSMWALGNAGMGALQRLSQDDNPSVAGAASEALAQLWERFEEEQQDKKGGKN